jgi:hypothetical protein
MSTVVVLSAAKDLLVQVLRSRDALPQGDI